MRKCQERRLIRQNAREVERRNLWEYYTLKIIAIADVVTRTRGEMMLIYARHLSELMDKRDRYESPWWVKPRFPGNVFQAIFWAMFGPDSHSLVRYFDHGQVPRWAKESKWTRKGK